MSTLVHGTAVPMVSVCMNAPELKGSPLAGALLDDGSSGVCLCTADDYALVAFNASARRWVGPTRATSPDPITLWCLTPASLRDAWRVAAIEAVDTGVPVREVGMVAGRWTRAAFRRLSLDTGEPGLLVVTTPIAEDDDAPHDARRAPCDDLGTLSGLTERELEVLRLIGLGMTSDQIAKELCRSAKTVQGHRNALGLKLGIDNRVELARIAIHAGVTAMSPVEVHELAKRSRRTSRTGQPG